MSGKDFDLAMNGAPMWVQFCRARKQGPPAYIGPLLRLMVRSYSDRCTTVVIYLGTSRLSLQLLLEIQTIKWFTWFRSLPQDYSLWRLQQLSTPPDTNQTHGQIELLSGYFNVRQIFQPGHGCPQWGYHSVLQECRAHDVRSTEIR